LNGGASEEAMLLGTTSPLASVELMSLTLVELLMPIRGNGDGYGSESRYVWFGKTVPFDQMIAGVGCPGDLGMDLEQEEQISASVGGMRSRGLTLK
jgi:hypothetical protein